MRRGLAGAVTAVAFMVMATGAFADEVTTQFRGGPARTGVYAGPPAGDLSTVVWRFVTGHRVEASPTVAGGVVYIGSRDGWFYALDEATGALKWRFKADAGVSSTAAVAQGVAYFQSNANTLYAVDLKTHRARWSRPLGADIAFNSAFPASGNADYWTSSPLLHEGVIYVGGGDGAVHAVSASDGRSLWRTQTGGRVRASPATDGRRIFVGSFDGVFYALDPRTGAKVWTFRTEGNSFFPVGHIQATAAVADGKVIFGSRDYWIYALDAGTGTLAWKTQHEGSWIVSSGAVAGDLFCAGGSDTQRLECDDLKTGRPVWKTGIRNNIFSSPAVAGGQIYVGSFMGGAVAFDLKSGAIVGYNIADGRSNSSPVVDGGVLFIGSDNGSVYAFGPKRG